jgi:hypothetical protein
MLAKYYKQMTYGEKSPQNDEKPRRVSQGFLGISYFYIPL